MNLPVPSRDGRSLVGPVFLASMGVAFAAVAVALHPDVLGLRTWLAPEGSDSVSLSYLAIEVEKRPKDRLLRVAYAKQLEKVGHLDQAADVLEPLMAEDPLDTEVFELGVRIELGRFRAAETKAKDRHAALLAELLRRGLTLPLSGESRLRLARVAEEVGAYALAAQFIEDANGTLDRLTRLERSARLYEEGGSQWEASERWLTLAQRELEGSVDPERLMRAVAALERAGRLDDARDVLDRWLERMPDERSALDPAIRLAWATGDLERAFRLSERRVRLAPEDPVVLKDHIQLALARGEPSEGLAAARLLAVARPGDRGSQVLRARVAEWSGRGDEALRVWWRIARSGDPEGRTESERLARAVGEERVLLAILSERLSQGDSDPELVEQVVFLSEAIGSPERARQVLRRASKRRRAPKRLAVRLARLEARMGLMVGAADRWRRIDERYGTTDQEALERAGLAWRTTGPESALEILKARGSEGLNDPEVASLVAELSWQLGERETAMNAHQRLLSSGNIEPHQSVRLMRLLELQGRSGEALEVAQKSLQQRPTVEVLLRGMELALRSGQPSLARALSTGAEESEKEARSISAYWRLRARVAVELGEPDDARFALERVIELDEGSVRAQADLLWLLIELDDRNGLRRWLPVIEKNAESKATLWPVLGAARGYLGHAQRALRWYALHAGSAPEDWQFWLDYALILEQVGRGDAAYRLRRYGLRKVPEEETLGRLLLGQGVLPQAELMLAARSLADDPEAPIPARRAAAGVLLQEGDWFRAERALGALGPASRADVAWHEARLGVALALEDRSQVADLLYAAPDTLSPALEAEGYALLGRYDRALDIALQSRVDERGAVTQQALLRYLERETRRRPVELHGYGRYLRLGELDVYGGGAEGVVSDRRYSIRLRGAIYSLEDRPGGALGLGVDSEARLAVLLERRWKRGEFSISVGLQAFESARTVPQASLTARQALDERFEVFVRATVFEVIPETPLLYTLGARERVGGGFRLGLPRRFAIGAALDLEHHHDRAGGSLGFGVVGDLRVSRDLSWRSKERLEVYVGGRALVRSVVTRFPGELEGLDLLGLQPSDVLPNEFATVGLGASLARGDISLLPTPLLELRYFADAWVGWQWPLNEPAYRLEAGVGTEIFGPDELYARGFFGNVLSGLEDVQAGLQIGYRWRFDP